MQVLGPWLLDSVLVNLTKPHEALLFANDERAVSGHSCRVKDNAIEIFRKLAVEVIPPVVDLATLPN